MNKSTAIWCRSPNVVIQLLYGSKFKTILSALVTVILARGDGVLMSSPALPPSFGTFLSLKITDVLPIFKAVTKFPFSILAIVLSAISK